MWRIILLVMFLTDKSLSMMQDFTLDINDILNENLMPASLMLIEERDHNEWKNLSSQKLDDEFQCITKGKIKDDGSFPTALHSMVYHRKMINEFLCSKFVAEKILENIQPKQTFKRRMGVMDSPDELEKNNSLLLDEGVVRERMLFDEGSYQYKNWLAKTTTLNDIYRTMGISRNFNENSQSPVDRHLNIRNEQYIDDMNDDEYEEGEVNGFMVQRPLVNSGIVPNNINALNAINANEKTEGLGSFGTLRIPPSFPLNYPPPKDFEVLSGLSKGYQYSPPPSAPQQETFSHGNYYPAPIYSGGHEMKPVNLKDIFEIALTTLAFLSFGMFIVQVIMCISMAKNSEMMLPMEVTGDGGEVEAAELEVRVKRSVDHLDPNIQQVNEISRRALRSFEAFLVARHDNGQCLKKFICENNKFSRKTVDLQKYLIPILGLGLSWVSNKITNQPITANLDNLQASIIGLGNGSCTRFKCDIKFLNHMRK